MERCLTERGVIAERRVIMPQQLGEPRAHLAPGRLSESHEGVESRQLQHRAESNLIARQQLRQVPREQGQVDGLDRLEVGLSVLAERRNRLRSQPSVF